MTNLPPLYSCRFCGAALEPNDPLTYQRVSGWVQNRRQTTVALTEREPGFACHLCIGKAKTGETLGQEALF